MRLSLFGLLEHRRPRGSALVTLAPSVPESYDMVASVMQLWRNAVWLVLVLNGHGQRTVVSVMPQGLYRTGVAAGTGPAWASYDVDAAFMHAEDPVA